MNRTRQIWLWLLATTALLLTGCSGAPSAATDAGEHQSPVGAAVDADGVIASPPEWRTGDWWRVGTTLDMGDGFLQSGAGRLVVAEATAGGYVLASEDRELAILDTYFAMLPVGPVNAELAITVADDSVDLYEWPMQANASWTTRFYVPVTDEDTLVSTDATLRVEPFDDEGAGRLRVQGTTAHGESVDYDFDAATGWLTYFRLVNTTTGRILLSLDVEEQGTGYQGRAHVMRAEPVYERVAVLPPCSQDGQCDADYAAVPPTETFLVDTDTYDFVEEIHFLFTFPLVGAGGGQVSDHVTRPGGPADPVHHTGGGSTFEYTFARRTVQDGFEGTWAVTSTVAGTGGLYVGVFGFHDHLYQVTPSP